MNGFGITHYAGQVVYNAAEFLFKNSDSAHPDTKGKANANQTREAIFTL